MVQRLKTIQFHILGFKKKGRGVDGTREIDYANNSLQKAGEAIQMKEITQNQGMKGGKPKLEFHETSSSRSVMGMSCQGHTESTSK